MLNAQRNAHCAHAARACAGPLTHPGSASAHLKTAEAGAHTDADACMRARSCAPRRAIYFKRIRIRMRMSMSMSMSMSPCFYIYTPARIHTSTGMATFTNHMSGRVSSRNYPTRAEPFMCGIGAR